MTGAGGASPLNAQGLPHGTTVNPEWEVTPRHVRDVMAAAGAAGSAEEKPLLLDCRREDEWRVARIEGAVLFPMEEISRRLEEVEEAAGGTERSIIVYCHHGRRSLRVAAALRQAGFADVKSMAGGIDVWSMDIDPGVARY